MDVLTNLRTFLMVARTGGFSEASRHLHVVPSVAAKRVSQLEKTVGAELFKRSTRNVRLTEAGLRMQAKAAELVAGFDDVVNTLKAAEGKLGGHIKVMAPTTLTMLCLGEIFSAFLTEHPQVSLEIALVDRSSNPLEEGFDIAISGRSTSYEGVIDIPLCPVKPLLCASPAYFKKRQPPAHPRDLIHHDCLVFSPAGSHWVFQSPRGSIDVDVSPKLVADDNLTLLQAAKAACGITVIPTYVARTAIAMGDLTVLLPQFPPHENWFKAYVPSRRHNQPVVKALIGWLQVRMAVLDTGKPAQVVTAARRRVAKR